MSSTIKQAIEALKGRIADCYTAVEAKGGTIPAEPTAANLPDAIESIPSGLQFDLDSFYFFGGTHPTTIESLIINTINIERVDWHCPIEEFGMLHGTYQNKNGIFNTMMYATYIRVTGVKAFPPGITSGLDRYTAIQEIHFPDLTGWAYNRNCRIVDNGAGSLKVLDIGCVNREGANNDHRIITSANNLIDIIQRSDHAHNEYLFRGFTPTNAISDSSTSLLTQDDIDAGFVSNRDKWNYNIREHIVANFPDISDESTTYYYYFSNDCYNALEAATIQAFIDKGWAVASI